LRAFLARATAKKKQAESESVPESCNESQMQVVVFQGQSGSGQTFDSGTSTVPLEPVRATQWQPAEPPITEVDESKSSGEDNDDYDLEHDPGLRAPISSYPINDQDLVRRAYIAMGRCQPNMKNFP